jgi:hypothetical protein
MERHTAAMSIADAILFLRRNGKTSKAEFLSNEAKEAGVDPGPIVAAWLEDV